MQTCCMDYVFKVEQMHLWYEPWVNYLGLADHAQNATLWSLRNTAMTQNSHEGNRTCFWAPKGTPCEAMFRPRDFVINATRHLLSGAKQLDQYYTVESAAAVTEWVYGRGARGHNNIFPRWDGRDGVVYMERIAAGG